MAFDPRLAFRVLAEYGVRYVIIGGLAAQLLGAGLSTLDTDICYDRSPENVARLASALRALHAKLRVGRDTAPDDLPFILDAKTLLAGDSFTFVTDAGSLDILATPSGTGGFDELAARATVHAVGEGLLVSVVALEDLMRMKRASGRPKDLLALQVLEELADVLREQRGEDSA